MTGYTGQRGTLRPARIGGVDLLIETVPVPGSEPTAGKLDDAVERVSAAFDRGQDTIVAIATKLAGTVSDLAARSVHPDEVEVEFGLSFSANGNVIVAGSTVEASLKVSIKYSRHENGDVPPNAALSPAPEA